MRLPFLPVLFGTVALVAVVVATRVGALLGPPAAAGGASETPIVAEAAGGTTGSVRTVLQAAPYRVAGGSRAEILASLRAAGPRVEGGLFFGLTTTEVQYRFGYEQTSGACVTRDASVDLAVTITLPEWEAPREAPYEVRRDWHRFAAALRRHEQGHRDLAIESAHRLQQALVGLRAPTCEAAAALAARQAERLQVEAGAQHRQYDERTGHGETEGAVWNG